MVIAISGHFCAGKDCLADYIVEHYGFRKVGFADKLKAVAVDLFGMVGKDRSLLQSLGSSMRGIRDTVWIDYVFSRIAKGENVVIMDMRYQNEFDRAVAEGAYTIRLQCPEVERLRRYRELYGAVPTREQIEHISETALDDETRFDAFINSSLGQEAMFAEFDKIAKANESH